MAVQRTPVTRHRRHTSIHLLHLHRLLEHTHTQAQTAQNNTTDTDICTKRLLNLGGFLFFTWKIGFEWESSGTLGLAGFGTSSDWSLDLAFFILGLWTSRDSVTQEAEPLSGRLWPGMEVTGPHTAAISTHPDLLQLHRWSFIH